MDLLEGIELYRSLTRITNVIFGLIVWNLILTVGIAVLLFLALHY